MTLRVIGEVAAGHPFDGQVGPGEAARIFTGGVLPLGADTIVIQEHTTRDGDAVAIAKPTDTAGTSAARHRFQTRRCAAHQRPPPDRPRPDAGGGDELSRLAVYRRPKVAIIGTGDELIMPGGTPKSGEIV